MSKLHPKSHLNVNVLMTTRRGYEYGFSDFYLKAPEFWYAAKIGESCEPDQLLAGIIHTIGTVAHELVHFEVFDRNIELSPLDNEILAYRLQYWLYITQDNGVSVSLPVYITESKSAPELENRIKREIKSGNSEVTSAIAHGLVLYQLWDLTKHKDISYEADNKTLSGYCGTLL